MVTAHHSWHRVVLERSTQKGRIIEVWCEMACIIINANNSGREAVMV